MADPLSAASRDLLNRQHGIIARRQAGQSGADLAVIDAHLRSGRWQPTYRGVYAAFTGPLPRAAVLWAAVLRSGPGAALSHHSAAELDGLLDQPSSAIHVTEPTDARGRKAPTQRTSLPPIVVHASSRLGRARHPARTPPRTRIEETALDLTQLAPDVREALSWLVLACSRRLTTSRRLLAAMGERPKLRWRREMADALTEIGGGVHSALEWRYVRRVESRHGLPHGARQARTESASRQSRYFDNYYEEFGVAVEVDGRLAHPEAKRWQDIHRDNASAALGVLTLRYNWSDVAIDPCRVAREIADVLRSRGWRGVPTPCSPTCAANSGTPGRPFS